MVTAALLTWEYKKLNNNIFTIIRQTICARCNGVMFPNYDIFGVSIDCVNCGNSLPVGSSHHEDDEVGLRSSTYRLSLPHHLERKINNSGMVI